MARVKRGVTSHAKHKKVLKAARGYYGRRKNTIRIAKQAVEKGMQYAYRDRKNKKRTFRALWIQRLNAAVREHGLTYSRFINALSKSGIERWTARPCPSSPSMSRPLSPPWSRRPRPPCRTSPRRLEPSSFGLRVGLCRKGAAPHGRRAFSFLLGAPGFPGRDGLPRRPRPAKPSRHDRPTILRSSRSR